MRHVSAELYIYILNDTFTLVISLSIYSTCAN